MYGLQLFQLFNYLNTPRAGAMSSDKQESTVLESSPFAGQKSFF